MLHSGSTTQSTCICFRACISAVRIREVKSLFRDASQTEFIIATIPTQLGIAESRRLLATLQEETIPCKRIIINQVRPNGLGGGPLLGHTPNTPVPT
jgi:anion-transporting  ArsA/GET3 family ATPase